MQPIDPVTPTIFMAQGNNCTGTDDARVRALKTLRDSTMILAPASMVKDNPILPV